MEQSGTNLERSGRSSLAAAWLAFGGLLGLGVTILVVRELPSMRRELRLMRM